MRVSPHGDGEGLAAARSQPYVDVWRIDWNRATTGGDRDAVVFAVASHLHGHGARVKRARIHKGQRDAVWTHALDQGRHVFGKTSPATIRIEVPDLRMKGQRTVAGPAGIVPTEREVDQCVVDTGFAFAPRVV